MEEAMMPMNHDGAVRPLAIRAPLLEGEAPDRTGEEFLDHLVSAVAPEGRETVLEVAAGASACGRALAPRARQVLCLDASPAMLEEGRREALASGLDNMVFLKGRAEDLPILDGSVDIVISRLAFHHFPDAAKAFKEMARVLRPGGKLVLIDMEAAEEGLRQTRDSLEILRDSSHVRNLSKLEMQMLFVGNGLRIEKQEAALVRQALDGWMDIAGTPEFARRHIEGRMRDELAGRDKTGFSPFLDGDGRICFHQKWILTLGRK